MLFALSSCAITSASWEQAASASWRAWLHWVMLATSKFISAADPSED